jgi:hypothetical protein
MGTNAIEQIPKYDMVLLHRTLNGFTNENIHKRPSSNEED